MEGVTYSMEIWTDHKNLEYFMMAKKLNRRQACWSLHLARFDFLLHHRPRCAMCKGDRSRRLQEIPQLIIVNEILLQPTSRRFLRELDEAPGGNNLQYIY